MQDRVSPSLRRTVPTPCRTVPMQDLPQAIYHDSSHFTSPSITAFCLSLFPGFIPKHLPPPSCLYPQLLPHTFFLCCSLGTPSPLSIFLPQSCCSFPPSTVSPLSFRQHCRHSPDRSSLGSDPTESIQCSQGPQVPSSVMGKTASLGREVEIIFLNFKYL